MLDRIVINTLWTFADVLEIVRDGLIVLASKVVTQ